MVSLFGGVVGVGFVYVVNKMMGGVKLFIDGFFEFYFLVDFGVFVFIFVLLVGVGLFFGFVLVLQFLSFEFVQLVCGGFDLGWSCFCWMSVLIIVQVVLLLMLLICFGFFLCSFKGVMEVDFGFDDLLSLVMVLFDFGFQGYFCEVVLVFFDWVEELVMVLFEIELVGYGDQLLFGMGNQDCGVGIFGYEFVEGELQSFFYV